MSFFSHSPTRFYLLGLAMVAPLAMAQPKLESIEYDKNETIINGESFGQGPKVVMFENFEHGDKFAKQFAKVSNDWSNKTVLVKEEDGNTAHSAVNSDGRMAQIVSLFNGDYRTALIAFSVKIPEGTTFPAAEAPRTFPGSSAWKFSWLMSDSKGHSTSSLFDVCLPQYSGGGTMSLNGNTGMIGWLEKPENWWSWDGYNHMISYVNIHPTSPIINPLEYHFSVSNDVTNYEKQGIAQAGSFSKTNNTFDRVNIPGWFRNTENANFQGLYDNLYVAVGDNALARVVITDSPVYAQSKFAVPVMAKNWSNDRIILDNDVLPTDRAYYVHIFDRDGKRSPKSLRICPKCPKMLIQ